MNNKDLLDISKITNSPSISGGGYVISAEQLNPDIEGSLANKINNKIDKNQLQFDIKSYGDTNGTMENAWYKLATIIISTVYQDALLIGECTNANTATTYQAYCKYRWRIKQQQPFGNNTINELSFIQAYNFTEDDARSIITKQDSDKTMAELWFRVSTVWTKHIHRFNLIYRTVTIADYQTPINSPPVGISYVSPIILK